MKKNLVRIVALILCAVLLLGMVPLFAAAVEIQPRSINQSWDGYYFFDTFEDLKELAKGQYSNQTFLDHKGEEELVISEDLCMPANTFLCDMDMRVAEDVVFDADTLDCYTLNVEGKAHIKSAIIWTALKVSGELWVSDGVVLQNEAQLEGVENITMEPGAYIRRNVLVGDMEELKAVIAEAEAVEDSRFGFSIDAWCPVEITESIVIPENCQYNGNLTIREGVTLNAKGGIVSEAGVTVYGNLIAPELTINKTIGSELDVRGGSIDIPRIYVIDTDNPQREDLSDVIYGVDLDAYDILNKGGGYWELTYKDNVVSGTCGENVTWTLEEGVLTISGTGAMFDFDSGWEEGDRVVPWPRQRVNTIVVGDGVTRIGDLAFYNSPAATVSIPDSVTSIGEEAFSGCANLKEVKLPENLVEVGSNAFLRSGLTGVTIPGSLRELGEGMLSYCHQLHSVVMEDGVEVISNGAFRGCSGLKNVIIPDSVTTIEQYAFAECHEFREITIPAGVTYIGDMALYCDIGDMFGLDVIRFCGSAPEFGKNVFQFVRATCYYPANDPTWDPIISDPYISDDCELEWIPYEVESTDIPGDTDGDGILSTDDVAQLLWHTLFPTQYGISGNADFNGDGEVNNDDVARLLWHILFPENYPL